MVETMMSEDAHPTKELQAYARSVEDLSHQLRTPILQAHERARQALRALDLSGDSEVARRELAKVVGLCAKARQVLLKSELLMKLTQDTPITLNTTALGEALVTRCLFEALNDAYLLTAGDRRITYIIERDSLALLRANQIIADKDLFEQAIRNIIDNAFKYSYPGTRVRVYGEVAQPGQFAIIFQNIGIPISDADVENIFVRGWRSNEASLVTGEGSGIGLYITDRIMAAHGGKIVVMPTEQDTTIIKLIFPTRPQ